MSKFHRSALLLLIAAGLPGCSASQMLSDARIADNTAGILGVAPSEVSISGRREAFPNTYYVAQARGVTYACTINGGTVLSFGMVNVPSCDEQARGVRTGRVLGRRVGL